MTQELTSISLFSGAFGLDLGIEKAGFTTIAVVDHDKDAAKTVAINKPQLCRSAIARDIEDVTAQQLLEEGSDFLGRKLSPGDVDLVSFGPPCQSFSYIGKREAMDDARGNLFLESLRIVESVRPRFCLMENVAGLLTARATKDSEAGSAFNLILNGFYEIGYSIANYYLLESANYGVPQSRKRLFIIGSRDGEQTSHPMKTHDENAYLHPRWRTLRDAIADLKEENPEYPAYSKQRLKFLKLVKEGENWRKLPEELKQEAMGGAYNSGGGKTGFYRRLAWDKPSPTITTSPCQKATDMCHPDYLRPLSVKECAVIQTFSDDWIFCGSMASKYKQIGNAVPPELGYAVAKTLIKC